MSPLTPLTPVPSLETDERRAFIEAIRDFAARECGTREQRAALTNNWEEPHNQGLYERLGELGWLGCSFPESYGGAGGGITDACVLMEELTYGQVPVHGLSVSLIVGKYIEESGTEAQKQAIIAGICRGEVAAIGMSEPNAGSDVAALRTRAQRNGDGYVINGQKTWTSCAHYAQRIMLVCRTDATGAKHEGLTLLDVPTTTPGVEMHQLDTLGGREVNDVYFTDARVPEDALIGVEGQGWKQLMGGLNFERLTTAAGVLGLARRAFDDSVQYVNEREQFGRTLGSFQVIKHRIADLATELECCRLLVYDVARRADADPRRQLAREASMAKLKASETAKRMTMEGMQMLGGAGYTKEHDMERYLREAIISTVVAGSSEIQREIIAKAYIR